jgi:hypothetical protein
MIHTRWGGEVRIPVGLRGRNELLLELGDRVNRKAFDVSVVPALERAEVISRTQGVLERHWRRRGAVR